MCKIFFFDFVKKEEFNFIQRIPQPEKIAIHGFVVRALTPNMTWNAEADDDTTILSCKVIEARWRIYASVN